MKEMDRHRRRANDYTSSLSTYNQSVYSEEENQDPFQTCSNNALDTTIKNGQYRNNKSDSILAGAFVDHSYNPCQTVKENCNNNDFPKDACKDSDSTIYLSLEPDLNKCINLFNNKYLNKEDTLEEYRINENVEFRHLNEDKIVKGQYNLIRDRPRSMSSNLLRDTLLNEELRKCKSYNTLYDKNRNTNNAIKDYQISIPMKGMAIVDSYEKIKTARSSTVTSPLKLSATSNKEDNFHTAIEDQRYNTTNSEKSSKEESDLSESENLKALLLSLQDRESLQETDMQGHLLRRMSLDYYRAPNTFTERLLTIIEESIINNNSCASTEHQDVSFCRLTKELQKMCKFIDDETILWPQSPGMSTSRISSPRKSLGILVTPTSPRWRNKSPKKIRHRVSRSIMKSPLSDSTYTFESLEAYCKQLYPDECVNFSKEKKNRLQSPLRRKDIIFQTCQQQMASLDSPDIHEQLKRAEGHYNKISKKQNLHKEVSRSVPDITKQFTKRNKHYETVKMDHLENSLMYEIAEKRQRCLATAKIMMEIDASSESTRPEIPSIVITSSSPINKDSKFMETLMSVKKYKAYLEERKPVLNYLQRIKSHDSRSRDTRNVQTKISNKDTPNVAVSSNKVGQIREFSIKRKKSPSPNRLLTNTPKDKINKPIISKPKLFITPGKTSVNKDCKPKRTYFTNTVEKKIERKINTPIRNIYRDIENYDHVVSPVGLYIRGTDPHLMKNVRSKTDEMLLTPRKAQTASACQRPKMKFHLSPKQSSEEIIEIAGDENVADNFRHPKVHYKLPSRVRTIKEVENRQEGSRMNKLLHPAQDKIVIRHEGRTKSIQTNRLEQPEVYYDSAEESVHVEQIARKTCFSRKQKDY